MHWRAFYLRDLFLFWENLTPDARRPVSFVDDADLAYIMRRYREIHDLTHVTLGMPINMLGKNPIHSYISSVLLFQRRSDSQMVRRHSIRFAYVCFRCILRTGSSRSETYSQISSFNSAMGRPYGTTKSFSSQCLFRKTLAQIIDSISSRIEHSRRSTKNLIFFQ